MSPKNIPRAPKIPPEPPKIIHFLLHSKWVAGVAAGVVNPATPLDRTCQDAQDTDFNIKS